jgi:hypothetical protein
MLHSGPDRRLPTVLASQRGTSGNNASEVQTFAAYAGITDITQIAALDYLIDNLKSTGLWSKMHFIYPFIGGNATSHKYELIDPSNSSRELVFTGVTHNSTGIVGTASANASAVSGINGGAYNTNNFSMGYYGTLKGSTGSAANESGVMYLSTRTFISFIANSGSSFIYYGPTSTTFTSVPIPDGFKALTSTTTTTGDFLFNQIKYSSITKGTTALSGFFGHELSRTTNTAVNTVSFSYASTQLTEAELITLNTIVEQYQVILGRNSYYINPNYQPETNRFLFNSNVSNFTENERNAVDYLVANLKAGSNLWGKFTAIYPYTGSVSLTASLKELRSLGITGLTIQGAGTQSSLGVETTTTNSYATYPAGYALVQGTNTIVLSIQEDISSAGWDFGTSAAGFRYNFSVRNISNNAELRIYGNATITVSNTDARGLYIIKAPSGASTPGVELYKNGSLIGTGTTGGLGSVGTQNALGTGLTTQSSTRIQGFYGFALSYHFTASEITEANSIITTYLSMLGRA